jgi:hypothetical protein
LRELRDPILQQLWRFVRGDIPAAQFEQWAYRDADLESHLGFELYLETISTDFSDTWSIRVALARHARSRSDADCLCIRLRDTDFVGMGFDMRPTPAWSDRDLSYKDVFQRLTKVRARGEAYGWLWAARCQICGQGWLVGNEEQRYEVFCIHRLDDQELEAIEQHDRWPTDFDTYERLVEIGAHSVDGGSP